MQLENLELTNFKCFKQQSLRFSKITLLLGANSSGKSSLLHGVLAAIQTDQFPLTLSANGALVDLGDFRELVHGRRTDAKVGIGLTFSDEKKGSITLSGTFQHSKRSGMPELNSAEISDGVLSLRISQRNRYHAKWTYDKNKEAPSDVRQNADLARVVASVMKFGRQAATRTSQNRKQDSKEAVTLKELTRNLGAPTRPSGYFDFAGLSELGQTSIAKNFQLWSRFRDLMSLSSQFRRNLIYVGSFRLEPRRSYYQVSKGDLRVLRDGQNTIEQIAAWQEKEPSQIVELARALGKLGLLSRVTTASIGSGLFEVKARPRRNSVPASLPDVGFGIGQLLPILVADLQLPKEGTLAVCQPEIHLHPSVQADLAEHFVRSIHSRKTRYIIETHSEYFLNRLRVLVANGTLKPEDLSIIYLANDGVETTAHEIRLLANGRIEGAPEDFFKTYMIDVMNIALSATKQ